MAHTKYTNDCVLRVLELLGLAWQRQRGHGPRTSVLMHIDNFEIRSLFTKLSVGTTLVPVPNPNPGRRAQREEGGEGE